MNKLTKDELERIAQIRASLKRNRKMWWVKECEATFFLGVIDKLMK